jgi:hypothetical protein
MLSKAAKITLLMFAPFSVIASPNGKATIQLQVDKATTRIHGSSSKSPFSYTDLIFAQIAGKKVVYECVQRDDVCPIVESGKTYTADQDGHFLFLSMTTPDAKKAVSARFKLVGKW